MNQIAAEVRRLEKERRDKMTELMTEYDETVYYPQLKALREKCTHNWRFTHLGPLSHPWFSCTICRKSEMRDK